MSRGSRRRARASEDSSRYLADLRRAQERVRRLLEPAEAGERFGFDLFRMSQAMPLGDFRRIPVRLYNPPFAKPRVARLSSGKYDPLRVLRVPAPASVRFCIRRKQRSEVLFARGIAGRRGSAPGKKRWNGKYYKRNVDSQYKC